MLTRAKRTLKTDPAPLRRSPRNHQPVVFKSRHALGDDVVLASAEQDENSDFDTYNYYLDPYVFGSVGASAALT